MEALAYISRRSEAKVWRMCGQFSRRGSSPVKVELLIARQGRTTVTPVIRRSFRIGLTLGLLGGLAFALAKMFGARSEPKAEPAPATTEPWPRLRDDPARPAPPTIALVPDPAAPAPAAPVPAPRPPAAKAAPAKKATAKAPTKKKAAPAAWVLPKGDVCPTAHPVKAKLTSKIFHLPGMLNYARTHPDRCYRDAKAAEADGLRPSKR